MTETPDQTAASREDLTARTFVELAGSLVDDFDVIDMLTVLVERSVELLTASTGGILLADAADRLRVMAASNEEVGLLELFQVQNDEGPCLDSFRTGETVVVADLASETRWPGFVAESLRAGFPSVFAFPLRHRDRTLGCLNLFKSEPMTLSDADLRLAEALAAVASITMVQDAVAQAATVRQDQLQHALDSRVAIEQAKGMIAASRNLPMDEAVSRLRAFARSTNRGLTETAKAVVAGSIDVDTVAREVGPRAAGGIAERRPTS